MEEEEEEEEEESITKYDCNEEEEESIIITTNKSITLVLSCYHGNPHHRRLKQRFTYEAENRNKNNGRYK